MKHLSIRSRLTCWYAGSLVLILSLFGGLIDALMHERLLARTDFELDEELHELVLEISLAKGPDDLRRQLDLRFGEHKTFEFRVLTEEAATMFESRGLKGSSIPLPAEPPGKPIQFATAHLASWGDSRIASQRIETPQGPMIVQAVMPLGRYLSELRDLRRLMLAIGPLMILVSIGGGYWLATRSLRPVDRMTQAAARITAQQLDSRLEVANPHDELGRLALTFNALLDRLERSFMELRKFTADAAHEFRTPLAVVRTSLEVALRSPRTAGYYQACLQAVAEENERLTSLANQLLLLAQEDAGLTDCISEPVDLADLLEWVKNDLEPLAEEKSQIIRCELPSGVWVDGDRQSLRRVCLNLLDNAFKFTPAGGEIELRLKTAFGKAELTIADTGSGIAAEHLPHIFERFYRVDPSRNRETGGAGLGLAICRAIVVRHGGEIHLMSQAGRGTVVRVELPLTTSPSVPASQVAALAH